MTAEIRVTRSGRFPRRVVWDPCIKGKQVPVVDITGMLVRQVERVITIDGEPEVRVTFAARLVEVEETS
jgi:hypothetical protein